MSGECGEFPGFTSFSPPRLPKRKYALLGRMSTEGLICRIQDMVEMGKTAGFYFFGIFPLTRCPISSYNTGSAAYTFFYYMCGTAGG